MVYSIPMESGNVVEFIERRKIMCAVVMAIRNQRLHLLTENNREVNISPNRLSHHSKILLDLSMGRDRLVDALRRIVDRRTHLLDHIDTEELWEILNSEQEWIDLATMTEFCFPDSRSEDHEAAVVRAFFQDKKYFKFDPTGFFPHAPERIEQIEAQNREAARKQRLIQAGGDWLKSLFADTTPGLSDEFSEDQTEVIRLLKSHYLLEKESPDYELSRAVLAGAGLGGVDDLFAILVRLKVWDKNENIELRRLEIPDGFSMEAMEAANAMVGSTRAHLFEARREDLTMLPLLTIDGNATHDFDDALSFENRGDHYRLGVHITDVGHFISRGDIIDQEALGRASSIYMPDHKIPMLPPCLAENRCSLIRGELRPAISTLVNISRSGEVLDYDIAPSMIRIKRQLTYTEADMEAEEDGEIRILHDIAKKFRQKRLSEGAIQISLPEIYIRFGDNGEPLITRTNRENPARMLVSELMIMANWIMARFLASHGAPAVFRSQPEPRQRLFKEEQGTLFQNWMQRKAISRFVLGTEPEPHSGLGLTHYVTATSPIRKYFDLVTQRQIRAILGLEEPYHAEELNRIIQLLQTPMSNVARVQYTRHRYWLLKHLERRIGQKEPAMVLAKRKNSYLVLLTEPLIECNLPRSTGISLTPEDLIRVTVQHVDARKDLLSVFLA